MKSRAWPGITLDYVIRAIAIFASQQEIRAIPRLLWKDVAGRANWLVTEAQAPKA